MPPEDTSRPSCSTGCRSCWAALGLGQADGLRGWRLVLAAAGAFLSPLVQGILGAVLVPMWWKSPHSQAVGAVGGLAVGLVDSWILVRCIKGTGRGTPPQ
jgi:hypothetical protein